MADLVPAKNVELKESDFNHIRRLIYGQCGIHLTEAKKELVRARLSQKIRTGPFRSFSEYYRHLLEDPSGQELISLFDAISTNYTSFFRESRHFEILRTEILPDLRSRKKDGEGLRLWSAGCSSGEEAYSIAMVMLEASEHPDSRWTLLATDISTRVLKVAASGIYSKDRIRALPMALVKAYFLKGENRWKDYVKVKDEVRRHIHFSRFNLMDPFRFRKAFDCIFCRNVMIYFDRTTQARLTSKFYDSLDRGGYLVIGHTESLTGFRHGLEYRKPTLYRKPL